MGLAYRVAHHEPVRDLEVRESQRKGGENLVLALGQWRQHECVARSEGEAVQHSPGHLRG